MSDVIERLLIEELRISNRYLPVRRVPLSKLLEMEFPHVVLRDGTLHFFRRKELEELLKYVENDEVEKLELPIIIVMRPDIGEGVSVVEDEIAARVIARVLGIRYEGGALYLYRPHVAMLRERFDTVFQIVVSPRVFEDLIEIRSEGMGI